MEKSGRKQGAQPGNLNRLKHGFYSKRLKTMTVDEAASLQENMSEEITLLRSMLRRLVELGEAANTPEEWGKLLETASRVAVRIASLVRTNYILGGQVSNGSPTAVIERVLLDLAIQDGLF